MRRTDIEQRLSDLGWSKGGASGRGHTLWTKAGRRPIALRNDDLIIDAVAEAILAEAEG